MQKLMFCINIILISKYLYKDIFQSGPHQSSFGSGPRSTFLGGAHQGSDDSILAFILIQMNRTNRPIALGICFKLTKPAKCERTLKELWDIGKHNYVSRELFSPPLIVFRI